MSKMVMRKDIVCHINDSTKTLYVGSAKTSQGTKFEFVGNDRGGSLVRRASQPRIASLQIESRRMGMSMGSSLDSMTVACQTSQIAIISMLYEP